MEFNGKTMTVYGEFSAGSDAHAADKNNPHEVTAEQAGAAPAGFGLGESASRTENWNAAHQNYFVRGNTNSPDKKMWYGIICKDSANSSTATEIAFSVDAGNTITEAKRARNAAGVWGQWEYVNPPMLFGVEYRTTERWNGKPVYTKLVDLGEHIDFSVENPFGEDGITVGGLATGVDVVTDAKFRWMDSGLTYVNNDGCQIAVDGNSVGVNLNNDAAHCEGATLLLKYTKI